MENFVYSFIVFAMWLMLWQYFKFFFFYMLMVVQVKLSLVYFNICTYCYAN